MDADLRCLRFNFGKIDKSRRQHLELRKANKLIVQFRKITFDPACELIDRGTLFKVLVCETSQILWRSPKTREAAPPKLSLNIGIEGEIGEKGFEHPRMNV